MRIPSGVTDQYVYFKAVDTTDLVTPETGLAGKFLVRRSRNGGAWTTWTTPTINATDTGSDAGIYELLVDEDTTLDAGDFAQNMVIHIQDTGGRMEPATLQIELFRPLGDTGLIVAPIWAQNSRTLTAFAHDTGVADAVWKYGDTGSRKVNVRQMSGDTGAASWLRSTFANGFNDTGITGRFNAIPDTGAVANAVWAKDVRTLTAFAFDTGVADTVAVELTADTGLRDAIARSVLGRPDVDGRKVIEAMRLWTAVLGGLVSGAGTATEIFSRTDSAAARVTATVDSAGNRSAITYALDT